jgi:hypothetical protein
MQVIWRALVWASRLYLLLTLVLGGHDFIGYLLHPGAYPIGTEQGDPRYETGARFLWTAAGEAGTALIGVALWSYLAWRGDRKRGGIVSVAVAALVAGQVGLRFLLW